MLFGIGNRFRNSHGVLLYHKFISLFYATQTGSLTDITPYNAQHDCPDHLNKYDCMFLTTTNCTLPKDLAKSFRGHDKLLYSSASADAEMLANENHWKVAQEKYPDLPEFKVDDRSPTNQLNIMQLDRKFAYMRTGQAVKIIENETYKTFTEGTIFGFNKEYFGYALRYRSEFRLKVQHLVENFRRSQSFWPNTTCVMTHMRKDDRSIAGVDMIDWCKNNSYYDEKTKQWHRYPHYSS